MPKPPSGPRPPAGAAITLLKGDLTGIIRARRLSVFGILLSPIIGAAAMALFSVSAIANAARLRTVKM
jgi:Cu+-exporting ATPase